MLFPTPSLQDACQKSHQRIHYNHSRIGCQRQVEKNAFGSLFKPSIILIVIGSWECYGLSARLDNSRYFSLNTDVQFSIFVLTDRTQTSCTLLTHRGPLYDKERYSFLIRFEKPCHGGMVLWQSDCQTAITYSFHLHLRGTL